MGPIDEQLEQLRQTVDDLARRVARLEEEREPEGDPLRDGTILWHEAMKVKNQAVGRK